MKICITLETGDGERIVEIDREEILQAMLARSGLATAVQDFENFLQAMIVSPARGMLRGKVHQLQDRQGYVRLVCPGESTASRRSFGNPEDREAFMEKIRCMAERVTAPAGGVGGDHGAACLVSGCAKE